ncbi:Lipin middle domain, partial [Trinorchestia longiramus]
VDQETDVATPMRKISCAELGPNFHPFSDTDISPPPSPGNSRPSTPIKSDTEYEVERHRLELSDQCATSSSNDNWNWTWGQLPTPPAKPHTKGGASATNSTTTTATSSPTTIASTSSVNCSAADQREDVSSAAAEAATGALQDTPNTAGASSKPAEATKCGAQADSDIEEAQRSMFGGMLSFMRATKKARHNPQSEGIYLEELNPDDLDPEVAALYFPKFSPAVGAAAAIKIPGSVEKREDDAESGNGSSLPQSPHSSGDPRQLSLDLGVEQDTAAGGGHPVFEYKGYDDVALSLCGRVQELRSKEVPESLFLQSLVSYDDFCCNPTALLANPDLVVRMGGAYYNWTTAAPQLLALVLFQRPLPPVLSEELVDAHLPKKEPRKRSPSMGLSWFGWRRAAPDTEGRTPTAATPTLAADSKSSEEDTVEVTAAETQTSAPGTPEKDSYEGSHSPPSGEEKADLSPKHGRNYKRSLRLTSDQIEKLKLHDGSNEVMFSVTTAYQGTTRCKCRIYLWNYDEKIIVSDIDGTITKSDVLGHILPIIGRDWAQGGVAQLFSKIKDNGYHFLYLSARAIGQARITRDYLESVVQEDVTLPDGPLLLNPTSLLQAFHREVIERKPEEFKISCLRDIQALFPKTGNPFYAGYGNRVNVSYGNRGNSSYGNRGGNSSYGNRGNSSYGNRGGNSSYGNRGGNSSYGNRGGNGSYGNRVNGSYGNRVNGSYGNRGNGSYGNRGNGSYGNRLNESYGISVYVQDVWAYCAVGIPISRVFTINHKGELKHELTQTFQSTYEQLGVLVDDIFPPSEARARDHFHRSLHSTTPLREETDLASTTTTLSYMPQNLQTDTTNSTTMTVSSHATPECDDEVDSFNFSGDCCSPLDDHCTCSSSDCVRQAGDFQWQVSPSSPDAFTNSSRESFCCGTEEDLGAQRGCHRDGCKANGASDECYGNAREDLEICNGCSKDEFEDQEVFHKDFKKCQLRRSASSPQSDSSPSLTQGGDFAGRSVLHGCSFSERLMQEHLSQCVSPLNLPDSVLSSSVPLPSHNCRKSLDLPWWEVPVTSSGRTSPSPGIISRSYNLLSSSLWPLLSRSLSNLNIYNSSNDNRSRTDQNTSSSLLSRQNLSKSSNNLAQNWSHSHEHSLNEYDSHGHISRRSACAHVNQNPFLSPDPRHRSCSPSPSTNPTNSRFSNSSKLSLNTSSVVSSSLPNSPCRSRTTSFSDSSAPSSSSDYCNGGLSSRDSSMFNSSMDYRRLAIINRMPDLPYGSKDPYRTRSSSSCRPESSCSPDSDSSSVSCKCRPPRSYKESISESEFVTDPITDGYSRCGGNDASSLYINRNCSSEELALTYNGQLDEYNSENVRSSRRYDSVGSYGGDCSSDDSDLSYDTDDVEMDDT